MSLRSMRLSRPGEFNCLRFAQGCAPRPRVSLASILRLLPAKPPDLRLYGNRHSKRQPFATHVAIPDTRDSAGPSGNHRVSVRFFQSAAELGVSSRESGHFQRVDGSPAARPTKGEGLDVEDVLLL